MDGELLFDWLYVAALVPAVAISLLIVARGNGARPLALMVLLLCGLNVWQAYDSFDIAQSAHAHIRAMIRAASLTAFPLWAAIKGGH